MNTKIVLSDYKDGVIPAVRLPKFNHSYESRKYFTDVVWSDKGEKHSDDKWIAWKSAGSIFLLLWTVKKMQVWSDIYDGAFRLE